MLKLLLLLCRFALAANAAQHTISVSGSLECLSNPEKHFRVDVKMYDWDTGVHKYIDHYNPDDLMGWTITDEMGRFEFSGRGSDFEIPLIYENLPEPYLVFRSYCREPQGELLKIPMRFVRSDLTQFDVFTIMLDSSVPGQIRYRRRHGERHGATWEYGHYLYGQPDTIKRD